MNERTLNALEAAMRRRIAALPQRIRPVTRDFGGLPRAILLTGARGVGKTTFLLHHGGNSRFL